MHQLTHHNHLFDQRATCHVQGEMQEEPHQKELKLNSDENVAPYPDNRIAQAVSDIGRIGNKGGVFGTAPCTGRGCQGVAPRSGLTFSLCWND